MKTRHKEYPNTVFMVFAALSFLLIAAITEASPTAAGETAAAAAFPVFRRYFRRGHLARRPIEAAENIFNQLRVWRSERRERFDERFGTTTEGIIYPVQSPAEDAKDIHPYAATPAWLVHRALASLAIDPKQFSFVDLGAGKGRALMVASEFAFSKIVGVEISKEFCQLASENMNRYLASRGGGAPFMLCCVDAADYEFDDAPLVVFLFNPFGRNTLSNVLSNLEHSLRRRPREVFVIYINPRFEKMLQRSALFKKIASDGSWLRPWRRYVVYQARRQLLITARGNAAMRAVSGAALNV